VRALGAIFRAVARSPLDAFLEQHIRKRLIALYPPCTFDAANPSSLREPPSTMRACDRCP